MAPTVGGKQTTQLPEMVFQGRSGADKYRPPRDPAAERIDRERGEYFHTNWTGRGGDVSSTTYDA